MVLFFSMFQLGWKREIRLVLQPRLVFKMDRKRSVRSRQSRYEQPSFLKRCKECTRKLIAFLFSNVGIIGLVVGYTIAGAFIFQKIEGTSHRNITRGVLQNRNETARLIWNITHAMNIFEETAYKKTVGVEMESYQKAFVQAVRKGYHGDNSTEEESYQWRFAGAFLYSLTVITTIGMGYNTHTHTHMWWFIACTIWCDGSQGSRPSSFFSLTPSLPLCFVVIKIY